MLTHLRSSCIFFLTIAVLLLIGCGQQGAAIAPSPTPTPTPTPGPTQWAAQASPANSSDGSWSFTFVVDPTATSVSSLKADFPAEFQCDGFVIDIPTGGNFPGPWAMTNGQFTIQEEIDILGSLTIDGTITQATKEASGTWTISNSTFGGGCPGDWTASPQRMGIAYWQYRSRIKHLRNWTKRCRIGPQEPTNNF